MEHKHRWVTVKRGKDKIKEENRLLAKIRGRKEYRVWRDSVIERHKICFICGGTSQLVAHHIESIRKSPDLAYSVENGLTLCRWCHQGVEVHGTLSFIALKQEDGKIWGKISPLRRAEIELAWQMSNSTDEIPKVGIRLHKLIWAVDCYLSYSPYSDDGCSIRDCTDGRHLSLEEFMIRVGDRYSELYDYPPSPYLNPPAESPVPHNVIKTKFGRNDPCPCGSGRKYKKCCGTPMYRQVSRSELLPNL